MVGIWLGSTVLLAWGGWSGRGINGGIKRVGSWMYMSRVKPNKYSESSYAREREVGWRVIQRLLKQDWGQANVVWDHTRSGER